MADLRGAGKFEGKAGRNCRNQPESRALSQSSAQKARVYRGAGISVAEVGEGRGREPVAGLTECFVTDGPVYRLLTQLGRSRRYRSKGKCWT